MIKQATKSDLIWGYFAQFLNVGSGIIIIPMAVKYLSSADMGLWYLFITIVSLAQLLEFGFQPTISRMTSYVYSGANFLQAEGTPKLGKILNIQLLYDLIQASKKIYARISIIVFVVLAVPGTLYLNSFPEFKSEQLLAWIVFVLSNVINFYFTYFNGLISGRGEQKKLYRAIALSKLVMLGVSIPLLYFNFGLLSMALGTLVSMLYIRFLLLKIFYSTERSEMLELSNIKAIEFNYIKTVWFSAWKLGLTSFGSFFILRSNMFIVSSSFGLKMAASYGLTLQVIGMLSSVSGMFFNLNLPKLNSLQSIKDKASIRSIMFKSLSIVNIIYILSSILLCSIGVFMLDIISANTKLVQFEILLVMLFMFLLELNHSTCATYLTTLNKVPFVYSSLISGALIVTLSLLSIKFTNLGLLGLILSQMFIQLLYNNWYWPLQVYKDLNRDH